MYGGSSKGRPLAADRGRSIAGQVRRGVAIVGGGRRIVKGPAVSQRRERRTSRVRIRALSQFHAIAQPVRIRVWVQRIAVAANFRSVDGAITVGVSLHRMGSGIAGVDEEAGVGFDHVRQAIAIRISGIRAAAATEFVQCLQGIAVGVGCGISGEIAVQSVPEFIPVRDAVAIGVKNRHDFRTGCRIGGDLSLGH